MSDTIDPAAEYAGLLAAVVEVATAAGDRLMADFSPAARPASRADMAVGGRHLEELVLPELRPELARLRPGPAGWTTIWRPRRCRRGSGGWWTRSKAPSTTSTACPNGP